MSFGRRNDYGSFVDGLEDESTYHRPGTEGVRALYPTLRQRFFTTHIQIYGMASTIRVSEQFREYVKAHKRDDETMEETLRRLIGGPHPESVVGFLSEETADVVDEHTDAKGDRDVESRRRLVDRLDDP